jgi:hypothetical protein
MILNNPNFSQNQKTEEYQEVKSDWRFKNVILKKSSET